MPDIRDRLRDPDDQVVRQAITEYLRTWHPAQPSLSRLIKTLTPRQQARVKRLWNELRQGKSKPERRKRLYTRRHDQAEYEAWLFRTISGLKDKGMTLNQICWELNRQGHLTWHDKRWRFSNLSRWFNYRSSSTRHRPPG